MSTDVHLYAYPIAFLAICLPGAGLALWLHAPGRAPWPVRVGLMFALGYASVAVVTYVLLLGHVLTGPAFGGAMGAVSVVAWVGASRRWRGNTEVVVGGDGPGAWLAHGPFLVVLAGALVVRATFTPLTNLMPTTLRYWTDALEIADRTGFPEATYQWGHALAPTVSKVLLNTFKAGMSSVVGEAILPSATLMLYVSAIALLCLGYALAWTMGLRRLAILLPLALFFNLIVGDTELTRDLLQDLAENWGRLVMLGGLILVIRALRERGAADRAAHRRDAIAGGVLFGVTAGTHLVPMAVGLALATSYALAMIIVDRRAGDRMRTVAISTGVAFGVVAVAFSAAPGDLGLRGASGDQGYGASLERLGLPPSFDPTHFLVFGDIDAASARLPYGPAQVLDDFLLRTWNLNPRLTTDGPTDPWVLVPVVGLLVGIGVLLVFAGADLRAIALTAGSFVVILLVTAVVFSLRYDLFALETFGNRRLFNYTMVPFALVAIGVGEYAVDRLARHIGSERPRLAPAVGVGLSLSLAAVFLVTAVSSPLRAMMFREDVELIGWIGEHADCGDRTLLDRRTLATFQGLVGRPAVVEGMGPHVRPDVLEIALGELLAARAFFDDPAVGKPYLDDRAVRYVVVSRPGHPIGGWQRFDTAQGLPGVPYQGLGEVPFLTKVYENPAGAVYELQDPAPAPRLLDPSDFPVYCGDP